MPHDCRACVCPSGRRGECATDTCRYAETARGDANAEGFVKVLVDLDGERLGRHSIGPDAATLVQVVVAMTPGSGTVRDLRESVHVHPALPEVVQRAFSGEFTRGGHAHQSNAVDAPGNDIGHTTGVAVAGGAPMPAA